MHDEVMARDLIAATVIQLQIDDYFSPDLGPPEDYSGPHLIATAHADRLVTLGSAGRCLRELPLEAASDCSVRRATRVMKRFTWASTLPSAGR